MAAEQTTRVRYVGGSADGITIDSTPEVFHTHPQRELYGTDPDAPFELYRNAGERDVPVVVVGEDGAEPESTARAVVFEFESAATERRLDDDMNPLERASS